MKPSIRKQDNRWVLTRPAFGFGQPQVTSHASWKAAREKLLGDAVGSAGPIVERGRAPPERRWGSHRGTIRMEDTA